MPMHRPSKRLRSRATWTRPRYCPVPMPKSPKNPGIKFGGSPNSGPTNVSRNRKIPERVSKSPTHPPSWNIMPPDMTARNSHFIDRCPIVHILSSWGRWGAGGGRAATPADVPQAGSIAGPDTKGGEYTDCRLNCNENPTLTCSDRPMRPLIFQDKTHNRADADQANRHFHVNWQC